MPPPKYKPKNDPRKKEKAGKAPKKSGILTYIILAYVALIASIVAAILMAKYDPEAFSLPPPIKFEGPLAENTKLQGAELLLKDQVKGPESIIVENGVILAAPEDGRIIKVVDGKIVKELILVDDPTCKNVVTRKVHLEKCGRPLGMRRLDKDLVVLADAYLGILTVDFEKNKVNVILAGDAEVDGTRVQFADDLDIVDENTIIFSDASTKYRYLTCVYDYLESRPNGRIIQLNLKTKTANVLLDGLYFPNGVQLFSDKQSVLVSETQRNRLTRYYLSGPKRGQHEVFLDNLPGSPDNIRLNSRGNFYVAMAYARQPDKFFYWDFTAPYPWIRKMWMQIIPPAFLGDFQLLWIHKYGLVVEVDPNGKYVGSLHDPTGQVRYISEVHEDDKHIYIASFNQPFIARVRK